VLFNTLKYAWFFAFVFGTSWALARVPKVRVWFLLLASYYFYAAWDVHFLPLIFASSSIDFWLAHRIHTAPTEHKRKVWLAITVILNLGVLAYFKYTAFAIHEVSDLLVALGVAVPEMALEIALPVGVSFFTFESMSYVIDVYRREFEPHESYAEYLTFVAFFPHLVAGPIVRPRDLLPQLARRPQWNQTWIAEGLFWIAVGLLKKVALGDYLAVNLVDRVFSSPLQYSALEVYAGVVGYALQIYCDFSGYTDIASGSALLLGVRFPPNFNSPYQAQSITEFWRRWHISLSTWLRDYLYIPLGGSRQGRLKTYRNLFLTMVLGGLWHGASWTFVLWGSLHGLLLAIERAFGEVRSTLAARAEHDPSGRSWQLPSAMARVVRTTVTFHLVLIGWVFFRAPNFTAARAIFARLASGTTHHQNLAPPLCAVLALALLTHAIPENLFLKLRDNLIRLPFPVQGLLLFAAMVVLKHMSQADLVPFVYFQF
jgi:alginate O-acetyltransferase complex protein AlgI